MKTVRLKQLCFATGISLVVALTATGCSSSSDDDPDATGLASNDQPGASDSAAMLEARALLDGLAADGGTPYDASNPVNFPASYNVFIPSITGVDLNLASDANPSGPTARIPMFRGLDPAGNSVDYILTETSDPEVAELMGIIFAPRMTVDPGSPGTQAVTLSNGIMQFTGTVDFSPTRFVTPGDPTIAGTPNELTRSEFPPADLSAGAVGDDLWSSQIILPSGLVFNAQLVANASGIHDRIPDSGQDDQSNPNLDRTNRFVVMQLLDGWHDGDRYFFHLVTDASVEVAAAIELGVFAPTVGDLPSPGVFPDGTRLGFAPSANGIADPSGDLGQGLNLSSIDQENDPVNVFPIDPSDLRYTPMWDAHIYMWTSEAIDNNERRIVTSIEELRGLFDAGLVQNFIANDGPENDFIAGLMPTSAIINCPVVMQPDDAAIGTTFGTFVN